MRQGHRQDRRKKSIFRSLFVPLFLIMLLQAVIFYFAAVYGGVERTLRQNAADILTERLYNRKNELETQLHNRSFGLDACVLSLQEQYVRCEGAYGPRPLADEHQRQIAFLGGAADVLIETLRRSETNGVFLILNDRCEMQDFSPDGEEKKYGLCIRDMDQESNYTGREDLLLERSPSSLVDALGCSLNSWWEAWYTFGSKEQGDYYYRPLDAAWQNPGAKGRNLAYFSGAHRISGSDSAVVSYSLPLMDGEGYPYGVVGVELSEKYLASLLPTNILGDGTDPCYVLALRELGSDVCVPIVGTGALYSRCFGSGSVISTAAAAASGGFTVTGRGDIALYGNAAILDIYDNNNPFEDRQLVLLALAESDVLFGHIVQIKRALLLVALFSLILGVAGILLVSRHFSAPITALAARVRDMRPRPGLELGRLGIEEIDQLVDAIEELNRNVSKGSARTEFFSRMSHDMRTPMNAIIGFSSPELLEGASETAKDDYLAKIHASGDYLLGLINEVLDMTKIESEKVELRYTVRQAATLCDTVIPIIQELAQKKGLSFQSEVAADPELYVLAATQHLDQIAMNLLSNAVKFTPPGGAVRLGLRVTEDARDAGLAHGRLTVTDTGIGMSEAFMRELYTPFEQENSQREGTGLGLSIAKKLVELMGGSIHCESRQNIGTTFTVELPLTRSTRAAAQAAPQHPVRAGLESLRGKRVLVCEDNALNTQIACHLLERLGIATEVAEDGMQAVNAFAASPVGGIDAILMDIQMPVLDGLGAARQIRALQRPDAVSVPIIAMTANAFEEDIQASRAAGMNEHLAKPIETKKFFEVLLRFLG